jgi:hypothetical protein
MKTYTDAQLHEQARKRVEFKVHLITYCIVIGALWMIWFFTGSNYPWPVWPMAAWGIGLIFHFMFEYKPAKFLSEEEEFEKLKNKRDTQRA